MQVLRFREGRLLDWNLMGIGMILRTIFVAGSGTAGRRRRVTRQGRTQMSCSDCEYNCHV